MVRARMIGTVFALAALAVTGCSADPTEGAAPERTAAESSAPSPSEHDGAEEPPNVEDEPTTIEVTIDGQQITPNGKRIEVAVGEPMRFRVKSDRAGELHVHSNPEQTLDYPKGTSTSELTIDNPGIVDVEGHESETVIVQLEVR